MSNFKYNLLSLYNSICMYVCRAVSPWTNNWCFPVDRKTSYSVSSFLWVSVVLLVGLRPLRFFSIQFSMFIAAIFVQLIFEH